MAKFDVTELDVVMLTYDEPNAEENWADLLNKAPWAKRVHGVKGFDAAHKEAARQSDTDRFITVDGDNKVDEVFFDQILDVPDFDRYGNDISRSIFSWNAKNLLNGLVYGNGGLKCWPKDYVLEMKTHEEAEDDEGMEFCWKLNYIQMNDTFSEVHQTASPFQAFRAGFREGVKMSLDQGRRVDPHQFRNKIWYGNLNRLMVWCNIGDDVDNGLWAIYGARLGAYKTIFTDWDTNSIADYQWFKEYFDEVYTTNTTGSSDHEVALRNAINNIGGELVEVDGLELFEPSPVVSKFFKTTYVNPRRWGTMVREADIQKLLEEGKI